ncbi:hypothetical protein [Myroides sp. DF42-4-2]|uniref:hypothetical protein n=1 Tax=Myroides sp. DF42-4-2 TaxID=2746726 RepID=UPI002578AB30|nr:hypothetical protein [Myroides sp. DF42-4-2]MDM1409023.1 hypothetical protein [Myroides sp. DF42-4-2]
MINDNIILFLRNRSWTINNGNDVYYKAIPPAIFNFDDDFSILIPKNIEKIDFNNFITNTIEILSDLYDLNIDDLVTILAKQNSVLKVRIDDSRTEKGKISLNRFEELVEKIKLILTDTASFVIDKNVFSSKIPDEAKKYVNMCNFMQTEVGSFVAKFQLPSTEIIKERELFDRNEIYSYEINNRLFDILNYVNENIFEGDIVIDEEILIENEEFLNVKLLKDIKSFYDKVEITNLDISIHDINSSQEINNQVINKEKISKLDSFVKELESQIIETIDFSFNGQVIELKSKNPDGKKNTVIIAGIYNHLPFTATASLNSNDYKNAIIAHSNKLVVSINGIIKRTRSKGTYKEIYTFSILNDR